MRFSHASYFALSEGKLSSRAKVSKQKGMLGGGLMAFWMIIFWGILIGVLLIRSYSLANVELCPDWGNMLQFSKGAALRNSQWLCVSLLMLWWICLGYWLPHKIVAQAMVGIVLALLTWWAMLVLLDAMTWWLPHIFTHSLWAFTLVSGWLGYGLPFIDGVLGGLVGYLGLWALNRFSLWYWHKPGFGGGDLFLSGALGSWFGWYQMTNLWLLAALFSLACVVLIKLYSGTWRSYIPFGPGLGSAGILLLLWNTI